MTTSPLIRTLGMVDFQQAIAAMTDFTSGREASSRDEIWLLQHRTVYTLGMAGKMEHVHDLQNIPLIKTDRGGQVTYHGPGQLIVYLMLDLKRRRLGIKDFVNRLEQSVIDYLKEKDLVAVRRQGAPGVYVHERKIAALGVRVRRSCTYHGLALNVNMDLGPFDNIDPCGYKDLRATQLADYAVDPDVDEVAGEYLPHLLQALEENSELMVIKSSLEELFPGNAAA